MWSSIQNFFSSKPKKDSLVVPVPKKDSEGVLFKETELPKGLQIVQNPYRDAAVVTQERYVPTFEKNPVYIDNTGYPEGYGQFVEGGKKKNKKTRKGRKSRITKKSRKDRKSRKNSKSKK